MFRLVRRPFAATAAALLSATFLSVPQMAQAGPASTVSGSVAAVPFTVTPANSSVALAPIVILPNMTTPVGATLGNASATPSQAKVWINGWCADAKSKIINFEAPPQTVTVPGDPSPTKGVNTLKIVSADLTIPAACVAKSPWSPLFPDGALSVEVGPAGATSSTWEKLTNTWIGISFVKGNIRTNTKLQWRKEPAESASHHTLPQKFEGQFGLAGLNIHDPAYLRWWCSRPGVPGNHGSKATEYNLLWEVFFQNNPNATKDQILAFRVSLQGRYKYTCP